MVQIRDAPQGVYTSVPEKLRVNKSKSRPLHFTHSPVRKDSWRGFLFLFLIISSSGVDKRDDVQYNYNGVAKRLFKTKFSLGQYHITIN